MIERRPNWFLKILYSIFAIIFLIGFITTVKVGFFIAFLITVFGVLSDASNDLI